MGWGGQVAIGGGTRNGESQGGKGSGGADGEWGKVGWTPGLIGMTLTERPTSGGSSLSSQWSVTGGTERLNCDDVTGRLPGRYSSSLHRLLRIVPHHKPREMRFVRTD